MRSTPAYGAMSVLAAAFVATACEASTTSLDGSSGPDGSTGPDRSVPMDGNVDAGFDGGVTCCPVDPPNCACVFVGGTAVNGQCNRVCDSNPNDWTYGTDENGCRTIQVGNGTCLGPPDAGPPDLGCAPVPRSFAGTWSVGRISVESGGQSYEGGACAGTGYDQHLDPLTITSDGRFSGRVVTDYIDTWRGCLVTDADGRARLDVAQCDVECYGHDNTPGRLGVLSPNIAPTGEFVSLTLERQGTAFITTELGMCGGCGPIYPQSNECRFVEDARLSFDYVR